MIRPAVQRTFGLKQHIGFRRYSTEKPTLGQFSKPLTSTFFLASAIYTTMHFIWWRLETDERRRSYANTITSLENELKTKQAKQ
ncbi:hypothetical protein B0I72DRAFT_132172 [Yarrowia lipolytica]|uniref:Uncharacterized protein n=1 Tax=Yarrowia lipolytica TaxID=4952 RepID=A0A371CDG8_YARLL|nr:Hypothetical protein YALI2_E00669g [Yarrowia lipolytica]RDW28306.1 hypothetical protein B0I71DRAFT_127630 [Yarrowia lipolytica]RDW35900.1 hypothetical protein B0I72DRAFT_132172 [Yarrowia lipolytica]RDW42315.1 hypothetical protein B0I73DRAFT_127310 [Yarrowia lipolytica]RDW49436.1 hypothetical protein B0I74DRAFT_131843 [Yarrowia lipolytica]